MPERKQIGSYQVIRELGKGGMGVVYLAEDQRGQKVALKVLPEQLLDLGTVQRFTRESAAMIKLDHPGIVKCLEAGCEKGAHFMAMEFLQGKSLKETVRKHGMLPIREAVRIASEAADALDYAHRQGIIHRDIKPDNLFILNSGAVKLVDFGVVQMAGVTALTLQGSAVGTPEYMAPEQVSGEPVDGRSDLYSLGITLYAMVVGHPPFRGKNPHEILTKQRFETPPPPSKENPSVGPELERIILKAMAKSPADRYAAAGEMRDDLAHLRGEGASTETAGPRVDPVRTDLPVSPSRQEGVGVRAPQGVRKGMAWVLARKRTAASAVGAVGLAGFLTLFWGNEPGKGEAIQTVASLSGDTMQDAQLHYEEALISIAMEDSDRAHQEIEAALRLQPGHLPYLRALARLQEKKGEVEGARSSWQRVLDRQPGDEEAREHLRWIGS
jgi:predicted Ser/Thr protein kinase